MAAIRIKLQNLLLDQSNPRITKSDSQREALQKIIDDQDVKLVLLAESIVQDRLNPMDRWLVIKSEEDGKKYVVLEGNRRLAALKILNNSAVLDDLEVRTSIKKNLQNLSAGFDVSVVGQIDCFEVTDRAESAIWINQRHTGENRGRGIVGWVGIQTARFRGSDPALQALDLVLEHGELTDDEKEEINNRFPITTLDRLLSTPAVRALIGAEIGEGKLKTDLPLSEIIKPLRRIVLDLAKSVVTVTQLKIKEQQVTYVKTFKTDLPDLNKRSSSFAPVETLEATPAAPPTTAAPAAVPKIVAKMKPKALKRTTLIPRDCYLTVSNPKIAEISVELRKLTLKDFPHSISVLFRVFLELSVDHYLTANSVVLTETDKGGHKRDKNLRTKVEETIALLISSGVPKNSIEVVRKGIDNLKSPLYIDTLHAYIHSSFHSPTERELEVAWNNSQEFFMSIWK